MKKILLTGGTGLVGKALSQKLLEAGYQLVFLSRKKQSIPNVQVYTWDPGKNRMEEEALEDVFAVIHLAGANVAEKRWTEDYKKEILESRILSTRLLEEKIKKLTKKPEVFVAASAIGYYGADCGEMVQTEDSPLGKGFLAEVTEAWENASLQIAETGLRTVLLRIGIVLSMEGGALKTMMQPFRFGFGAALGSGKQKMSWIHIGDLCRMFEFALENPEISGIYNAVGNHPVSNREFSLVLAKTLGMPLFLPNIPGVMLKIMLGEMGEILTGGILVSSEKIQKAGFSFQFHTLEEALQNLVNLKNQDSPIS